MQNLNYLPALVILFLMSSISANAERGGASGGGGEIRTATIFDSGGITPSKQTKHIFIQCPDNTIHSCGTCQDAIGTNGEIDQVIIDNICTELAR